VLVYLDMYAKSGQYSIIESNINIERKFFNFLTLLKPILKEIDDSGDAYVLLLPYNYAVVYNLNTTKYEYSVEYAIIEDTQAIDPKKSIKASGIKLQYDSNNDDFIKDIKYALTKKSAKKKYILATNYPLYERLRQEFAQDIDKGELEVKSVYTVGLFYYISQMVNKNSINQNIAIDSLCSNPNDNTKTFSGSEIKDTDNFLIANRSSLSMAGLSRNGAQAVLTLSEEVIDGLAMFYGFQLNAPNVICKGAKELVTNLLSVTSIYSNIIPDNNRDRYYTATKNMSSNIKIPEDLKLYVEIARKVAEIVFENTPKDIESFLSLVNKRFIDDLEDIVDSYIKPIGYEQHLISLIEDEKKFKMLDDFKDGFYSYMIYAYRLIENNLQNGLEQVTRNILGLAASIKNKFSIEKEDYYKQALPLATLIHICIRLIRYRDANKLITKDYWLRAIDAFENIMKKNGFDLNPPQSDATPNPNPSGSNTPSASPTSSPSGKNLYVLSSGRFTECDLFDGKNAAIYSKTLLPQNLQNGIYKDPLKTIIDIADYICNFSGGMFSNVDQIYKLEEDSVPDVPVSFNKYELTNLMIHTCDQREDATKLLYRQARVDVEAVANNIALDIVNGQFSSNRNTNKNNEYFLNIIVLKSKYTNLDFTDLKNLSKELQNIVSRRVEAMSFVLDDKYKNKALKDTKDTYKFICNIHEVNEDDTRDLEKILRDYNQNYCQNIVYMLDDHQQLHEMHLPLDEIQRYTVPSKFGTKNIRLPLTGYAHYVIAYAWNYHNPIKPDTDNYKQQTRYRVLMNSKSFSHDYVRLLAYVYLLFDVRHLDVSYQNKIKKIDVEKELHDIFKWANYTSKRHITFSNKPYTVSLKAIRQFIDQVKSKTWYSYGFSRCNPEWKKLFEEYYEISNQVYEAFIKSADYANHAHKIISTCQAHNSNAMDSNIGRVYVSILKPQEFSAVNSIINKSTQNNSSYNMYFEKIKKYVQHVVTNINNLYSKFSKKLSGYDTPDIDYNIETKLLNTAFKSKGKTDTKAKLRFLDDLELDYLERIAYIMGTYMLKQLRVSFRSYADWIALLETILNTDKLKTILSEHLKGLNEETYDKVDKLCKSLNLSNTEKVILIMNYLYLNRLYTEQYQDIEETFRVLTEDLLVTNASEASIYRTQILIAGIRMFLQNFICDLYSKSKGNEFMDANRFSGNYLIICEDSDIAAALASSLSILLHFRSKTNKAMKEIELIARQFYSNLFKTLYKRNTKWYEKIKNKIIGNSKNNYYDEELRFINLTFEVMNQALSISDSFINSKDFNSDYPLYGLSALVFLLSMPMTVSLAMTVGDKDSVSSMIGMVYKYQDAMSAHGITLANSYCEAGYEQPELELPEDTELSHITDFPVSTNVISKENIFDKDNYEEAITTISEILTHRAKTMDHTYGQVIVTDDITRITVDMSNVNTIIILAGRRNTFSQSERQGTLILDKQVADSLYEQAGRRANVYYVTFEYDSRIDDMTRDSYLKPKFNTNVQSLYSVMGQVNQIGKTKSTGVKGSQTSQSSPTVLTIAII